jgi:XTP/dITP diphosphohydrolase
MLFEGVCEGTIRGCESGEGGFGYDPLFVPAAYTKSFAELGDKTKNQLSHRGRALAQLKKFLDKGSFDR